jgi:glycosyltransferase involved in cell wall biosynthesis
MDARISVIVPTIERPSLDSTISSIYNQELNQPPEIIKVVDTERKGFVWAVNEGLKHVKTPYVFICDDDVVLKPEALNRLLEALYFVYDAGYAYGDYEYKNHPMKGGADGIHYGRPFDPEYLMEHNYISTMSLIRTRHLKEIGGMPDGRYPHDWLLWKKLLEKGICGVYSPGIVFTTTFDEDSQMAKLVAELGL